MQMRYAERCDLPYIADIASKAMMDDELSLWLSPTQAQRPGIHRERCLRTTIRRWNAGKKMLVVVTEDVDEGWDGTPRIVAYAAYEKECGALDDSSKVSATISGAIERFLFRLEDYYIWYFRDNHNTDKQRWNQCFEAVASNTAFNGFDRYWELDFLAVDPSFARRGLGSQLIDWGKARAAEDRVPLLLWSSNQGYQLYLRHGFKVLDTISIGGAIDAPVMAYDPSSLGLGTVGNIDVCIVQGGDTYLP